MMELIPHLTVRETLNLILKTIRAWRRHRVPVLAAALSYYTLFSIPPLFIIIVYTAGLVADSESVKAELFRLQEFLITEGSSNYLATIIDNYEIIRGNVFINILGILFLFWTASRVFMHLKASLDIIWDGSEGVSLRRSIYRRILAILLIISLGFVVVAFLLFQTVIYRLTGYIMCAFAFPLPASQSFYNSIMFISAILLFALIFRVVPEKTERWLNVLVGGVFTSLLFFPGLILFTYYVGTTTLTSVYGPAGSLVVFLVWVYFSSQVILFGAQFTKEYSDMVREAHRG